MNVLEIADRATVRSRLVMLWYWIIGRRVVYVDAGQSDRTVVARFLRLPDGRLVLTDLREIPCPAPKRSRILGLLS